jgi:CheY-like chemotaxis protein/HPt (histidine-containing phosphotransfer) domain-containing protein
MLRGWQLGVDEAESAADVRRGPVAPDGTAYAAILIASRLADGRGFDLAASLRAGPSAPPAIVTLLTTEDERADRARSRTLHAAAVTKPVSHAALLATLCRALDIPADDGDVGESGETSRGAPDRALRILIAEDNPINQELIRTLLGRRGHATVVAETGLDAVDLVMRERFDAVLMDVQMPELDGLEATRAIRARERDSGRRTPIVALTAGTTDDARTRCEEAGMDAHLTKPIDAERLVETVESLAAASTHPTDPIHPTHPTDSASSPAIEIDRLMQRLDGDVDLLRRMTAAFLGDCPRTIGTLEVAIRRQDARAVEHAAHYLKGAGANLCAPALVGAAAELERAGRDGDLTHAEDLRDRLLSTLEALRVELTRAVQVQGATAVPASRTA